MSESDDFDLDDDDIISSVLEFDLDFDFSQRIPAEPNPDWPEGYRSIFIKECVGYDSGLWGVETLPYFEDGQWWIGLAHGRNDTQKIKAPLFEITRYASGGHEQDEAKINALTTEASRLRDSLAHLQRVNAEAQARWVEAEGRNAAAVEILGQSAWSCHHALNNEPNTQDARGLARTVLNALAVLEGREMVNEANEREKES